MDRHPGRCASYREFWPVYLREHARPATRALHYLGTSLGLAFAAAALLSGRWMLLPLALLPGYAFAWLGHWRIERNRPATFGHPWWSFLSDFRMLWLWATGRLGPELARCGLGPGSTGADRPPGGDPGPLPQ